MAEEKFHFRGRYIGICEKQNWEFAFRTNASAVAVLVPMTDNNELVLVEQFRVPVQSKVIELPAGLVGDLDDPDESVISAAARELEEETGFRAGKLETLLYCPSSAGLTDEMITIYLATELEKVGNGGGDDSEDIVVHLVPLGTANEWLSERMVLGQQVDPKIYAALYWLERYNKGLEPVSGTMTKPGATS